MDKILQIKLNSFQLLFIYLYIYIIILLLLPIICVLKYTGFNNKNNRYNITF